MQKLQQSVPKTHNIQHNDAAKRNATGRKPQNVHNYNVAVNTDSKCPACLERACRREKKGALWLKS